MTVTSEASPVDSVPNPPPAVAASEKKAKLFGRTQTVHQVLGAGQLADILLWKKWLISSIILSTVTLIWFAFEWSGFTLLTLLAGSGLVTLTFIFTWAQLAIWTKFPGPPIPELILTEELVQWTADSLRREINGALAVFHSVALGTDFFLFVKVVLVLVVVAYVGSWFSTLNLFFFGVLLSFTLPVFYDKYEDQVDAQVHRALEELFKLLVVVENKAKELLAKVRDSELFKKKTQ